jgi:hypothetical protein
MLLQRRTILSRALSCVETDGSHSPAPKLMDRFATPSECSEQATLCRTRADAADDERLRAVWVSMAQMWTELAAHRERLQRLNAQEAYSDTSHKPKSPFDAHAPIRPDGATHPPAGPAETLRPPEARCASLPIECGRQVAPS